MDAFLAKQRDDKARDTRDQLSVAMGVIEIQAQTIKDALTNNLRHQRYRGAGFPARPLDRRRLMGVPIDLNQWHRPLPASRKLSPSTGMNSQS